MSLVLNILWIVLGGGLLTSIQYLFGGLVLCLTVVGIPFGLQCFKLAGLAFLPFGKEVGDARGGSLGCLGIGATIVWLVFGGIEVFLTHLALAVATGITIIGIPFAVQHVKLAQLALVPFGREVREAR